MFEINARIVDQETGEELHINERNQASIFSLIANKGDCEDKIGWSDCSKCCLEFTGLCVNKSGKDFYKRFSDKVAREIMKAKEV